MSAARPAVIEVVDRRSGSTSLITTDLARDPSSTDALAVEEIAAVVSETAAIHGRLAARLASLAREARDRDEFLTADELADRLKLTTDWVRRASPPFMVRLSGGAVRYSTRGLARWIERRT